ncbi:MAG: putative DNA binding domain-containing protein [bacterium]|nr:putative DNA binding domain-containing protein [Acidimicrobiia bacterium]MCY4649399.1 putative DNA binding domain-containing protein [bacterium]
MVVDKAFLDKVLQGGETLTVEFKTDPLNDAELAKAVVCLANANGGHLLIGVEDDGTPQGAQPRHGTQTYPNRIQALIASRTDPSVETTVELVEVNGVEVVVIKVPVPGHVVSTTDGFYTRRALDLHGKPQCLPMRPHEILSRAGHLQEQDFTRFPISDLTLDDLSESEFDRLRTAALTGDNSLVDLSNTELLRALDCTTNDQRLTVGALLLFGRTAAIARYLPAYEVGFQELDGLEVRTNQITSIPLLRALAELEDRVMARNPEQELQIGLQRVALPSYSKQTVRELIANALIHRDYTAKGVTLVEITADAMQVSNPGGFPAGVTISRLLTAVSNPRNPTLANAFKRAGLIERTSRGINLVFKSQLTLGRPVPDYNRSNPSLVVARVPSEPVDKELARFVAETLRKGQQLELEDLLVLHEVSATGRVTTRRAAELFQDQSIGATLYNLVDKGILKVSGRGRGRSYRFTNALAQRFGQRGDGSRRAQQRRELLDYVGRTGSISRREAVELWDMTPDQASLFLREMRDQGLLEMVGRHRASRYVLPKRERLEDGLFHQSG